MRLVESVLRSATNLKIIGYSESDVIKNMCPLELGFFDIDCKNEAKNLGLEGCIACWNREM